MTAHVHTVLDALALGHNTIGALMGRGLNRTSCYDAIRVLRSLGMLRAQQRKSGEPAVYTLTQPAHVVRAALAQVQTQNAPHPDTARWSTAALDRAWRDRIDRGEARAW